jgi:pyruvate,water dikinase
MIKNLSGHLKNIFTSTRKGREELSFELLFKRFRDVLDNNNRALEIITDVGEKLGGDYLFDITYVKRAYSELTVAMQNCLQSFDLLTRGRYPQLHGVLSRISDQIKRTVYETREAGVVAVSYENITWDKYHEVGGKNANLSELKNHLEINVPDAFVITTSAFDELMRFNGLDQKIQALGEGVDETSLRELRQSILDAKIPPLLEDAFGDALETIRSRCGGNCFLAVRSSAEEEDSDFSFAGQFETELNIASEKGAVEDAYKRVVASTFSQKPVSYLKEVGLDPKKMKMAVGCMVMVDAVSSGVIYTSNPGGDRGTLIISAAWGLGASVVEGQTDTDLFVMRKKAVPEIISKKAGNKGLMITGRDNGGTERADTPDDLRERFSLTEEQAVELTRQAVLIERHFRRPQDIEWSIDRHGRIFILQSRPLRIQEEEGNIAEKSSPAADEKILTKIHGILVQRGAGAGRFFILKKMDDLDNFPRGAVLVARNDSSDFIRIMPYVSAIITDTGTPTSHMAALCREFRVPTLVNAGNATQVLKHGQDVTVHAGEDGTMTIYDGIARGLLERVGADSRRMENIYEFRKKRYVLRYIAPLNLIDPLMDNFAPEACKTLHDVLRFIHEKSVAELVDSARDGSAILKKHAAIKLKLPIPTGIMVIDIGGGLDIAEDRDSADFEQISSLPLRAIIKGMMHPGVWRSEAVSLRANDFLTSMLRATDIISDSRSFIENNVAVVSREYMNLSLRFGYHFNMIDCYCSENTRNNHIFFRFVGGATDISKRSRRLQFIAAVLKEYGFNIKIKGDLIIARIAALQQDEIQDLLDTIGRLIAYTRQLDAVMHDDRSVERYTKSFLNGTYES